MIDSNWKIEEGLIEEGYSFVIGVDEAGRGPLAGPVVACACTLKISDLRFLNPDIDLKLLSMIRDSKLLSEKQREELYDFIHDNFYVGIGICDHETIDRINILQATYLAMKKAIASLTYNIKHKTCNKKNKKHIIHNTSYMILVDGNKIIPNLSMKQKAIVGGDKIVKSISAASIMAKVTRDRIMREMDRKYPQYGFLKHKGYGTKMHREMIKKHGSCDIHRKSFTVR